MTRTSAAALLLPVTAAAAAALLLLLPPPAGRAAGGGASGGRQEERKDPVKVAVSAPKSAPAGKPLTVTVTFTVDPEYHIYPPAKDQANAPTTVTVQAPPRFAVGTPAYPKPHVATIAGDEIEVYEGTVRVTVPVTVPKDARGPARFTVRARYQACTAESCLPPKTVERAATVTVAGPG